MRPSKKTTALWLYESGTLEVIFKPNVAGVIVPEHLKASTGVMFTYGVGMPIPITDTVIDDEGISATLSFNRTPCSTFVPWAAVFVLQAKTDEFGAGMLWPEDAPTAEDAAAQAAPAPVEEPAKRERPSWMKAV